MSADPRARGLTSLIYVPTIAAYLEFHVNPPYTSTTYKVLFTRQGENVGTPPSAVGEILARDGQNIVYRDAHSGKERTVNLDAVASYCMAWDNDGLVKAEVHRTGIVKLPTWLSLDEYLRDSTRWVFGWAAGVQKHWPESWQRGLTTLGEGRQYAAAQLLGQKTIRSEFRQKLRDQIVVWLETAPDDRKYNSPLSPKQWDCILNRWVEKDAKRTAQGLYYNLRYSLPGCEALDEVEQPVAVAS